MKIALVVELLIAVQISAAINDGKRAELDKSIAETLSAFAGTSVSVAVVDQGKLAYQRSLGMANVEKGVAATANTRYAVGSISKQFTAAALLLAHQEGKLSIDDKVARYFPDLTRSKDISIRQLLSHTSGYEDYAPQDYIIPAWTKPTSANAIMDTWAKKPLNFEPGTKWQYSNTNFVIAGKILEKATGENLVSFLERRFFAPLQMLSAGEWLKSSGSQAAFTDADAYTRFALGPPRPVAREGEGWYFAAGELSMTAADLAKWDIALLQTANEKSSQVMSERSFADFTREVKLKDGSPTHYALGLSVSERMGVPALSHSGEVSGFLASNVIYPTKNVAVIVFSNEDGLGLVNAVSQQVSAIVLDTPSPGIKQDALVKQVLEDLQNGSIENRLFTDDAQQYFSDTARGDYQSSLSGLGKLVFLTKQSEQQRGGMTHLIYQAHFQRNTVGLNIYLLPDGKIEQFLVEEQF